MREKAPIETGNSVKSSKKTFPLLRSLKIGLVGLAGTAIFRIACDSDQVPSSTPAPIKEPPTATRSFSREAPTNTLVVNDRASLERRGDKLVDRTLFEKGDRTLRSVEFRFDPAYAPGDAGGSLAMETCFEGDGFYRIISREENPRQGWLVDVAYPHETECVTKHPVTELAEGDEEVVFLGVGKTSEQTYQSMRTYEVERNKQGLSGTYSGKNDINPAKIQLRDKP